MIMIADEKDARDVGGGMLEAALKYAEQGLRVFPVHWVGPDKSCGCGESACPSPGKHPLTGRGHKEATSNPEVIREWWRRFPNGNIAAVPADDQFVVDVDPRNDGDESLKKLEAEHGSFSTRTVRTGSGGLHFWFETPTPVRGRNNLLPGIDIKTSGGYVLMPPSLHVLGQYSFEHEGTVAQAPESLIDFIGSANRRGEVGSLTPEQLERYWAPGETEEDRLRWTRSALDAIPNEKVFDDRNAWIGMAHAIRAALAEDDEESFVLFDQFSKRWKGGSYEADETRRVWETLPASADPGGYPRILRQAREEQYSLPSDHPWRAENVFEVDPNATPFDLTVSEPESIGLAHTLDLIHQVGSDVHGSAPELVKRILDTCAGLQPVERIIAEGVLHKNLERWIGRDSTRSLLRSFGSADSYGAFRRDGLGAPILRRLEPTDVRVNSPYLVHKRIPAGGVGALISDFSLGKTWLAIDLGCSVAFGRPWLESEVTERPVIFLIAEGNREFMKRVVGWLYAKTLIPAEITLLEVFEALEDRVIINKHPPRFDDPDFKSGLINTIEDAGAGLVIVDTLGKTLGDDQSENDNDIANAITGMLSEIAAKTDCTTLFTHHSGHGQGRARGASGWEQGLDVSYFIKGESAQLDAGHSVTLTPRKMKDGEWPTPVQFRLKKLPDLSLREHPESEPVRFASAVVEVVDVPVPAPELPLKARVFLRIQENPSSSQKAIRDNVEGGHRSVDQAIDELMAEGAVEDHGTPTRHSYNTVPGWVVGYQGLVESVVDGFETDYASLDREQPITDGES